MGKNVLEIGGVAIGPAERKTVDIEIPALYSHTPLRMPVHIIRGRYEGPSVFITAAVHGNELNGIEIIRRLKQHKGLRSIRGTLMLVSVVNVYGLINRSRYTPDRRDLNRSFPGSEKGSIASRLAHVISDEILSKATLGIDLHTGAIHRSNLPQIRTNIEQEEALRLAKVFGAPVVLNSQLRDGSLRAHADELGIPVLLYEAGEALRLEERSIRIGLKGILNVLRDIGMLSPKKRTSKALAPVVSDKSSWVRAGNSGMMRLFKALGERVEKGELIACIDDPLGESSEELFSPYHGIVIGRSELPLVQEGDAVYNVALFNDLDEVEEQLERHFEGEDSDIIEIREDAPLV